MGVAVADSTYQISSETEFDANRAAFQDLWDRGVEGHFTGRRDVTIFYRTFTKPDGGPAVVISNGRTESMIKYQEVIYDLYNNGYQVFILDHRGQGFSDREPDLASDPSDEAWQIGDVKNFDHYVDDLKLFVDSVVMPTEPSKLFLLAHSMGGGIASLYLIRHPDVFDAAAMTSPMHRPNGMTWLSCGAVRAIASLGMGRWSTIGSSAFKKTDPKENSLSQSAIRVNWFNEFTETIPKIRIGPVSNRWIVEACKLADRLPKEAGQIRTKLLILQASEDSIVSGEAHNVFCAAVNEATPGRCRLESIVGAKHEILVEKDDYRTHAMTKILDHFKK